MIFKSFQTSFQQHSFNYLKESYHLADILRMGSQFMLYFRSSDRILNLDLDAAKHSEILYAAPQSSSVMMA